MAGEQTLQQRGTPLSTPHYVVMVVAKDTTMANAMMVSATVAATIMVTSIMEVYANIINTGLLK